MDNENNVYPDFVPNQVLTNRQLNQLREYLDKQNRLGRVRLTGTGLVCGLNVALDQQFNISISDGFGVSSDGYLLELDSDLETSLFTHCRKYTDPNQDEEGTVVYEPWREQLDILQLVSNSDGASQLTSEKLHERVLVLYLEQNNVQLDSCLVTDCDSKGVNVQFTIRVLLVKKNALQKIPLCKSAKGQLLRIPRLYSVLRLSEVEEVEQINKAYQGIIEKNLEKVTDAVNLAYKKYKAILSLDETLLESLAKLELILQQANQYSWDILNDIADAYNEFISLACELLSPCFVDQDFTRHLMLGALDGETGYRNQFIPSRVRNAEHNDIERVRKLFMRIVIMAEMIHLKEAEEIVITPSHTALYPLGKRALPCYYAPELEPFWQPQMCCTTKDVWSYHFKNKLSEFDYAGASFLRIEGHLGRSCNEAGGEIHKLKHGLNLEFDLLILNINEKEEDADSLVRLAEDISGIEHTAGVVKGGTFILLCDEQKRVVADFSLAGQVPCCRNQSPPVQLGSIGGRFTIKEGAGVDGAKVILKSLNSSFKQVVITDSKAGYLFADLQAGTYTVQASRNVGEGNVESSVEKVQLAAGENKIVNLTGKFVPLANKSIIKGRVLDKNNRPVPDTQITIRPINKTQNSDAKGEFEFNDLNPDTYTLQASVNFNLGELRKKILTDAVEVKLNSGDSAEIILRFKQSNDADDGVEKELPKEKEFPKEIEEKTKELYSERIAAYAEDFAGIPTSAKRSNAGNLAQKFIHEIAENETSMDETAKQYNNLVAEGLKKLASSNTTEKNKVYYRDILSTVSLAMLDSMIMSNPETLDTEAETVVNTVKSTLNKADIPLADFKNQWNAKQLEDELSVSSVSKVNIVLG